MLDTAELNQVINMLKDRLSVKVTMATGRFGYVHVTVKLCIEGEMFSTDSDYDHVAVDTEGDE